MKRVIFGCQCRPLSLTVLLLLSSAAESQKFSPAALIDLHAKDSLNCPVNDQSSPVLFCQVALDASGRAGARQTFCFGNKRTDVGRARSLEKRLEASRFEPARVNGVATPVFMSLRVLFRSSGDQCEGIVLPNLGFSSNELGASYFAPQEIYTNEGWIQILKIRRVRRMLPRATGISFAMSVAVDETGIATDGRIETRNTAPVALTELSVQALLRSRFIPAFVEGRPVAARYYEILWVRRRL